jgi:hypothetical protein
VSPCNRIPRSESLLDARRSYDRTVHGRTHGGNEIVRYDRAGKWYVEGANIRKRVSLSEAAKLAAVGEFYPRLPGGQAFDARVRKLRSEMEGHL